MFFFNLYFFFFRCVESRNLNHEWSVAFQWGILIWYGSKSSWKLAQFDSSVKSRYLCYCHPLQLLPTPIRCMCARDRRVALPYMVLTSSPDSWLDECRAEHHVSLERLLSQFAALQLLLHVIRSNTKTWNCDWLSFPLSFFFLVNFSCRSVGNGPRFLLGSCPLQHGNCGVQKEESEEWCDIIRGRKSSVSRYNCELIELK